jgi:hypothetical protein
MDPANLVVVVLGGAAVLFLVWLASRNDPNQEPPLLVYNPTEEMEPQKAVSVPEVGREIPFPLDINTVPGALDPKFERPKILNYYFTKTRLIEGPPSPDEFLDEFFVEFESPEGLYKWTAHYTVATPQGLKKFMEEKSYQYVYGDDMVFVKRYELDTILRAVLELQFAEIMIRQAADKETTEQNTL